MPVFSLFVIERCTYLWNLHGKIWGQVNPIDRPDPQNKQELLRQFMPLQIEQGTKQGRNTGLWRIKIVFDRWRWWHTCVSKCTHKKFFFRPPRYMLITVTLPLSSLCRSEEPGSWVTGVSSQNTSSIVCFVEDDECPERSHPNLCSENLKKKLKHVSSLPHALCLNSCSTLSTRNTDVKTRDTMELVEITSMIYKSKVSCAVRNVV